MELALIHHLDEIAVLCRRFGVARMDAFGSAVTGEFDPGRSDVDLVIDFLPEARAHAFDNYFGLHEALERLFGRPVDLMTASAIRNPYLRRAIESTRTRLYGS
jgi:predicted nucleotidyltransferase